MAYELAVSEGQLNDIQLALAKQYCLDNYVKTLTSVNHKNSSEDIFKLEKFTRGQNENMLWKLLRINRITASGATSGFCGEPTTAMNYGLENEKKLKLDNIVMSIVRDGIEEKLGKKIKEEVLECGLFLSEIGLYSASPDAYFELETGELVVLEIKCPYKYRNETLHSIKSKMNNTRNRYRIQNTALSINRHGDIHVTVEKQNEHYRQMQSQLYVTKAILAVYMVKFQDMPEIHFVERDEEYIKQLREREVIKLKLHVNENKRNNIMVMEKERFKSLQKNNYDDCVSRALSKDGLYCRNGVVVCYFCNQNFETADKSTDDIKKEHQICCNKSDNISMVEVQHGAFLNVIDRINNLKNTNLYSLQDCRLLAKQGLFHNGSKLTMYCCGGNNAHTKQCARNNT